MPMTAKEMARLLLKNGFKLERQFGSHQFYVHPDGRCTTVPMHAKDLKKGTEQRILKDAGLK